MREKNNLKKEIIDTAKRLYQRNLVVAASGNISAKVPQAKILITRAQAYLADLSLSDIIEVDLLSQKKDCQKEASSELPLHRLVYQNFPAKKVIHCHPPLTNGYFSARESLRAVTFETRFYLGDVPVLEQTTPTVTEPEKVIEALGLSNIVVLKNHGVVAMGDNWSCCLALIESLEAAVKSAALAAIFEPEEKKPPANQAFKQKKDKEVYPLFSAGHIKKIVELVNQDKFIEEKGKELDLTLELAIKMDNSDKTYRFSFEEGKIKNLSYDAKAPFVISAGEGIWRQVFLGKIDPFVAVTQGKMNLSGQLGQLSHWYVPFSRLFELFKEVDFE